MSKSKKRNRRRPTPEKHKKTLLDERYDTPIEIEFIDHSKEGIAFLNLIKTRYKVNLSIDQWHFHYFIAAGNEFIGIFECQISEDLTTVFITKALLNEAKRDVAMTLMSAMLSDAFDHVYINEAHWIINGKASVMFNPFTMPEIESRPFVVSNLTEEELMALAEIT